MPFNSTIHVLQNMASVHIKVKKGLVMYFTWPIPVTLLRVQWLMLIQDNVKGSPVANNHIAIREWSFITGRGVGKF